MESVFLFSQSALPYMSEMCCKYFLLPVAQCSGEGSEQKDWSPNAKLGCADRSHLSVLLPWLLQEESSSTVGCRGATVQITHCSGFSGHQDSERCNCVLGVQNSSDTVENPTLNSTQRRTYRSKSCSAWGGKGALGSNSYWGSSP